MPPDRSTLAVPQTGSDVGACRRLVFAAGRRRFSLPLHAVSGVLGAVSLRRVPLAPDFVLGLLERHGGVVTVLHLGRLVRGETDDREAAWVRLAPPWDHIALRVDAPVHVAEGTGEDGVEPLDPAALLALAESAIAGGR